MALTVQTLFDSLKNFDLQLVAGSEGLSKNVSWIYYIESPDSIDCIRGGELAITTGLNIEVQEQSGVEKKAIDEFLSKMIQNFSLKNASGLIVKTGHFIDTISSEICSLCDRLKFPLFILSAKVPAIDVMQEAGNLIATENQKRHALEQCLCDAIFHKRKEELAKIQLPFFENSDKYAMVIIEYPENAFDDDKDELRRYIEFSFNPKTEINPADYLWFLCEKTVVYLIKNFPKESAAVINRTAREDEYFADSKISVSGICKSIYELDEEYSHAKLALKLSSELFCDYDTLGFFKILAEVKNKTVLEQMYQSTLGRLSEFSPQKRENYIDTLRTYIETNGKVQKTADENYTHRNTINYRINKLSEILGVDLQNGEARFLIQTALYIGQYLDLIK